MQRPADIVLITIDSLRADHLGCYGGRHSGLTPHLDAFAASATRYVHAFSDGPNTPHAFPAILAGRPSLADRRLGIFSDRLTLAERLQADGYLTIGVNAGNPYVSRHFAYDRGFDRFEDYIDAEVTFNTDDARPASYLAMAGSDLERYLVTQESIHRKAVIEKELVSSALTDFQEATPPVFFWLHLMDAHYPYVPQADAQKALGQPVIPLEENRRLNEAVRANSEISLEHLLKVKGLYRACVLQLDQKFAQICEFLNDRRRFESALIIFVSDHGEEFREHGDLQHRSKVYNELLHVPLLVKLPGQKQGELVSDAYSLVSLPSLILETCGLTGFRNWSHPANQVQAAASYVANNAIPPEQSLSRTHLLHKAYATIDWPWKVITMPESGTTQLFNLLTDQGELMDLSTHHPEMVAKLGNSCRGYRARLEEYRERNAVQGIEFPQEVVV